MKSRRAFIKDTGAMALGSALLPAFITVNDKSINAGVQLYTVRKEMMTDPIGILKQIAALGYKQVESASSDKGHYYGLKPAEIKKICADHGMTIRSGHIHLDDKWKQTLDEASETGQEYLICANLKQEGQTVDNYKRAADDLNKAGEDCRKRHIKFGYHNHDAEFEQENGQVLYDILLEHTDPSLVHMELDLGWVTAAGMNPIHYFTKYPGRFPLWHLKDMTKGKKKSTEFGKGALDIKKMFNYTKQSGMKYFFVEQEDYSNTAMDSLKHNIDFLKKL